MKQQYDVVLLAGGSAPWLEPLTGTRYRILAPIAGQRMLDYILQALKATGRVKRILLTAEEEALKLLKPKLPEGIALLPCGKNLPSTALKAVEALGLKPEAKVFFICDDIPLITPEAIEDFLAQCEEQPEAEAMYPLIPKEVCLKTYPEAKRTYGTIQEGSFTGGNMMLVTVGAMHRSVPQQQKIFELRKSPLKLCSLIGWSFMVKLIFRRLTLPELKIQATRLLHMQCHPIISSYASVGMDVDKPADLELIEKYLNPNK